MKNLNLLFNKLYYEKLGLKKYSDEFPDKSGTNLARQFWSDADNSNSKKKFLNTLIKDYEKRNHNNFNKNSFFADRNTQSKIADYNVFDGDLEDKNEIIENIKFQEEDYQKSKIECRSFVLKTTYPGFLTGTGQPHGAGDIGDSNNDVNMGFSFDYVTGQPIIAGSSVKGVLRSHFENHAEAVAEILKKDILNNQSITEKNVKNLMTAIFNNSDVFLDAVIRHGDDDGKIMGFDYITPHESTTKNPVPIKIIKVLPDVVFEFRFIITNKTIDGISILAENILKLFEELLCLFGSGAKTNVGYGMFSDETQTENATDIVEPPPTELPSPKPPTSEPPSSRPKINNKMTAVEAAMKKAEANKKTMQSKKATNNENATGNSSKKKGKKGKKKK